MELRNHTKLDPRLRELALMTVGRIAGAEYEFVHHWNIALNVGVRRELAYEVHGAGLLEIDADVSLAGVLLHVEAREAVSHHAEEAGDVAARRLDLDHVRTEIREQATRERSGDEPREVEHADATEWMGLRRRFGVGDGIDAARAALHDEMTPSFRDSADGCRLRR